MAWDQAAKIVRRLWIVLAPLSLSGLLFFQKPEFNCLFAIGLMSLYWIMETVPLPITSLLPVFLFPLLGIAKAEDIAKTYTNDTTMILFVSLIMGIAVEETHLHHRVALKLLTKVGTRPPILLLGFMLTTSFISFFVSDSATTAIMIPIAVAILKAMVKNVDVHGASIAEQLRIKKLPAMQKGFCKALIMACSQASLIGGTAILTSTAPNLIFRDAINKYYSSIPSLQITYLKWCQFAIPPMFVYLLAAYLILICYFIGPTTLLCFFRSQSEEEKKASKDIENSVLDSYNRLGNIKSSEMSVIILFLVLILSWVFRAPGFMRGWADFHSDPEMFTDASSGIVIVFLLFICPRNFPVFWKSYKNDKVRTEDIEVDEIRVSSVDADGGDFHPDPPPPKEPSTILTWEIVHRKMSWSVLLLIGAGFAISDGVKRSKLSSKVACMVLGFEDYNPIFLQVIVTAVIVVTTEFMSNSAAASIFVPIVQSVSVSLRLHPYYLGIPSAIAPSFAFMLPTATPPNALVFDTRIIRFRDMVFVGLILNIFCVVITVFFTNTWTYWLFDMGTQQYDSNLTAGLFSNETCN